MRTHGLSLAVMAAAAALGAGATIAEPSHRRQRRELTLDEEEIASVRRMLDRHRYRQIEERRRRQRAEAAEKARIAAEKEAARPKSRQELRAMERRLPSYEGREATKSKPQSESLKRLLGKDKRGSYRGRSYR